MNYQREADEIFRVADAEMRQLDERRDDQHITDAPGIDPAEPPPPNGPGDYGLPGIVPASSPSTRIDNIPLSIDEWLARDLPELDRIMGEWLTTTSRVLFSAPTGLGKTNFLMAVSIYAAAGMDFLHWRARRPARVLFFDGEMSRRLLKRRIGDAARRLGVAPAGLHFLSREDVEECPPLNSPAGKAFIERVIDHLGVVDLVIFDNIMSLLSGEMKEEEGWLRVLPLVRSLTARGIGQIWVHHTGHDASHSYGTKTREWGMDTVLLASEAPRDDTDVSFKMEFKKARERTPETRRDFADVTIALVNDRWECSAAQAREGKISPLGRKFIDALRETYITGETQTFQSWKAVMIDAWRKECERRGLIDPDKAPHSARSIFSKYKRELIAANYIACNNDLVWLVHGGAS